jgi:imidazolonepropionase
MIETTLWTNARLAPHADPATLVESASIVTQGSHIAWLGPTHQLPVAFRQAATATHDLGGAIVTPGLVDCHTHLVYGGNRAEEFALRLAGASYEDIAKRGGGIISTVRATREATEDELFQAALRRLDALRSEGVTAIEIKSGYGLDLDTERKMLRVARRLGQARPVTVSTTFLGAHALPPEYAGRADDYIDLVCNTMLPALVEEKLVDAVDVFCEGIGFDLAQSERVFQAAQRFGLPVKMHA